MFFVQKGIERQFFGLFMKLYKKEMAGSQLSIEGWFTVL